MLLPVSLTFFRPRLRGCSHPPVRSLAPLELAVGLVGLLGLLCSPVCSL